MVGVPLVLLAVHAELWPDDLTWEAMRSRLTSPDNGTLMIMIATVALWLVWAYLAVALVVEMVGVVRKVRVPRIHGLPQGMARRLVVTATHQFSTQSVHQATALTSAVVAAAPVEPRMGGGPPFGRAGRHAESVRARGAHRRDGKRLAPRLEFL
jgi:hypothetical protein